MVTPRGGAMKNMLANFFGASSKKDLSGGGGRAPHQAGAAKALNRTVTIDASVTREEMEAEYKQVISDMQNSITAKVTEVKGLREELDRLRQTVAELRKALEAEKDRVDDANTNVQEYMKQKQQMNDIIVAREKEIVDLTQQVKLIKNKYDKDVKKIQKTQQSFGATGVGSMMFETEPKMMY